MPFFVYGKNSTKVSEIKQILTMDSISPYILVNADNSCALLNIDTDAALSGSNNQNIIYAYVTDYENHPTLVFEDTDLPIVYITSPGSDSASDPIYTTNSIFTVTGTVETPQHKIVAVYVNGHNAVVENSSWSFDLSLSADVVTKVEAWAIDDAGRESLAATAYVMYDSAVPSVAVTAPTSTTSSVPVWVTSSSYTVSGVASDSGSGVSYVTVNGNTASGTTSWSYSLSLSADTTTAVTIAVYDKAGRSATVTRYVMYDSAAPSLSVTAPTNTSSSSPAYTTASSYTVSGTASDSGSGIKSVMVNGYTCNGTTSWSHNLALTGNTATTVTIVATDNAGRTTTATRYVMYDSADPTLTVTQPTSTSSSSPTASTSSSGSYTVSGTASDSGSGLKSVTVNSNACSSTSSWSYSLSLTALTTTTVSVVATDNAGRTTTATRYVYNWYKALSSCSAAEVQTITQGGQASNVWSVGDYTDSISLSGTVGYLTFSSSSYRAMLIGFNHNNSVECSSKNCITLQFATNTNGKRLAFVDSRYLASGSSTAFRMNTSETNSGGWKSSYMRGTICSQFLSALPSAWQNIIQSTTKYTDNTGNGGGSVSSYVTSTSDKVFLLSGLEVYSSSYANTYEGNYTKRYTWYSNNNSDDSRIRCKHNDTDTWCFWWLRSPYRSQSGVFTAVTIYGYCGTQGADWSGGFAPAVTIY